jgi:hypothetical protein
LKSKKELSSYLPILLRALEENNLKVDILHLYSLGSITLESFNDMDLKKGPRHIILNRAFASTSKAAENHIFYKRILGYITAYFTGWIFNPEISFFEYF